MRGQGGQPDRRRDASDDYRGVQTDVPRPGVLPVHIIHWRLLCSIPQPLPTLLLFGFIDTGSRHLALSLVSWSIINVNKIMSDCGDVIMF